MKTFLNSKKFVGLFFVLVALVFVPSAFAHVVVRPAEVGVGSRTNFIVSVPTEENLPTTQIRLIIPEGLRSVRPNVKPGWTIQILKTGEGDGQRVSEIIWSGGSIPAEQRDEFIFSAQAPANEGEIVWKAYQTYADGLVVAWDTDPIDVEEYAKANTTESETHQDSAPKPFSVTKVVNDLAKQSSSENENKISKEDQLSLPFVLSIVAVLLGGTALFLQLKTKK